MKRAWLRAELRLTPLELLFVFNTASMPSDSPFGNTLSIPLASLHQCPATVPDPIRCSNPLALPQLSAGCSSAEYVFRCTGGPDVVFVKVRSDSPGAVPSGGGYR